MCSKQRCVFETTPYCCASTAARDTIFYPVQPRQSPARDRKVKFLPHEKPRLKFMCTVGSWHWDSSFQKTLLSIYTASTRTTIHTVSLELTCTTTHLT